MKNLPETVSAYKQTPVFDQGTIPKGFLADHQTKPGTWGKIIILEGELEYTINEPEETLNLNTQNFGVIEPEVLHHIKPLGAVRLYIEFYR